MKDIENLTQEEIKIELRVNQELLATIINSDLKSFPNAKKVINETLTDETDKELIEKINKARGKK